jgi:hypothetical protein
MITLGFDVATLAASLPDDVYQFDITGLEKKLSSAGNDMLAIELTVINHPDYNGRKVYDNISLLPQTAFRVHNLCKALNVNAQNLPENLDEAKQLGWLSGPVAAKTQFDRDTEFVKIKSYIGPK